MLDNIYTTDTMSGQNGVLTSDFSDHFLIFTIRHNMEPKIPDKYRYKREFTNKNKYKLNKQFNKIDWNSTLNTDSVLLDFSCFFALIKDIFDSWVIPCQMLETVPPKILIKIYTFGL